MSREKSGCFGSGEGCCSIAVVGIDIIVVIIIGCICAQGKSLSRFSIFLRTCWCSASKSKGACEGVALERQLVFEVIRLGRGAGGVIVMAEGYRSWQLLLGGQKGKLSMRLAMAW